MRLPHPDPPGPPPRPEPEHPWPEYPRPPRPAPAPPRPAPALPPIGGPTVLPVPPTDPDPVLDRLLDERILYLGREPDATDADRIISRLLLLAALDPRRDITLHLNTTAGSATAGMAVYDTLRSAGPDVATRAIGLVGSLGTLLLAAGTPGKRTALPHARILLRLPSAGGPGDHAVRGGIAGQLRQEMTGLLARHTGRPVDAVAADLAAERWLSAPEAVEYGLVDAVIEA